VGLWGQVQSAPSHNYRVLLLHTHADRIVTLLEQ